MSYKEFAPEFKKLPEGFEIEPHDDTVTIRKLFIVKTEKELFFAIVESAKELYTWVDYLEDIPDF